VSVGDAESQSSENASALIKRADVALYASKSNGRNVGHWHDGKRASSLAPDRINRAPVFDFSTTDTAAPHGSKDFGTVCNELRQRLVAFASEER